MPVDATHPLAKSLARNVGSAVRAVRERRGYSQIELAERVGVSMQTISNIERGEGTSLAVLAVLAHELAVHISELVDEGDLALGRSLEDEITPLAAMLEQEDRALFLAILRLIVEHSRAARAKGWLDTGKPRKPSKARPLDPERTWPNYSGKPVKPIKARKSRPQTPASPMPRKRAETA